jgi:hypothetical protein
LNGILKAGLIALGSGVACFILLMLLNAMGISSMGPCGFDSLSGWVLFFGFLIGSGCGIVLTAAALLKKAFHKIA